MTQQVEAMKRWLEALEKERDNYFHGDTDGAPAYLSEAITEIREAIAELEAKLKDVK